MLLKQALDALKARSMAQKLGLTPHPGSQWKWALRNMRDGQGNPLDGRELAEAKESMGKLPNNVRQKVNAASRVTGHRYEVATAVKKDNSEWDALSSQVDLTSPSLQARQALKGADEDLIYGEPQKNYFAEDFGNGVPRKQFNQNFADYINEGVGFDVAWTQRHTHPQAREALDKFRSWRAKSQAIQAFSDAKQALIDQARRIFPDYAHLDDDLFLRSLAAHREKQMARTAFKNQRHYRFNFGDENSVSTDSIVGTDVANHVHTHVHSPLARHEKPPAGIPWEVEKASRHIGSTGAPLVYPSGFTTRKIDHEPYGDLKVMEDQATQNPNTVFNILDPRFGNEGVHKIRPQGMRSIYFQNQADETPFGLAKLAAEWRRILAISCSKT